MFDVGRWMFDVQILAVSPFIRLSVVEPEAVLI